MSCTELYGLRKNNVVSIGETIDSDILAIAWNQTSVSSDVWTYCEWNGKHDIDGEKEYRNYDLSKDDKHWFLFEEIEKCKSKNNTQK